jgi:hypothetical protein
MRSPRLFQAFVVFFSLNLAVGVYANIVYSTDFNNTAAYTEEAPVSGQDGWFTSSQNNPGPGAILPLNFNDGIITQQNSFVLGGDAVSPYDPSTAPDASGVTTILHAAPTGNNGVNIRSEFDLAIANPPPATFGYSVFSTTGYNLLNVLFTPTTTSGGALAYQLGIQSAANDNPDYPLAIQPLRNQSGQNLLLMPNSFYDAAFNITDIGTTNQSIALYTYSSNIPTFYGSTSINYSDFSASPYNDGNTIVGYVGVSWINQDAEGNALGSYGDNSIVVQNLTLTSAVPEASQIASSVMLLCVAVGIFVFRQRKEASPLVVF